ncbi:hypothetical protein GTW66_11425 [Streptomyces sp. SID5473]|uniref:Uncharacterized protein n=1 Tax=Streptomyces tsukubensis (strain DSM 42081 / NBRC 108919 / NRRL 18488 / 9993) TaxID=1114943 RepID=I2N2N5_STRT9|nr:MULTISPECIES: hypothetical protein [Streptomyces]AZK95395.1 hypothetical protein B7R87_17180 [Streptomyces tsukubensis]EIF91282.1 putative DNA-binding protein [Streptomyces tsukubensis NRRL18488]MYS64666.1 hypothetical protein [Streptomyces sp. SID5473]QKM68555.1 hypothetical protein STSU_016610 [Streptomyces tsukubensis NRRL18488]TAI43363.1 hypothetical protein EWI31_16375 [Streptomyces tsukubensis]
MAIPNSALRAVRMGLLMSQDDFARAVREAGNRAGRPNNANKRLVRRWDYRGARYHGAVQLLVEPTGRRMAGKGVGFGKDFDINTGPWTLTFEDASTTKATLASYDRKPTADS